MVECFWKLKKAIRLFLQDHQPEWNEKFFDLLKDSLNTDDWMEIDLFIDLLKPFEYLTRKLQGNSQHKNCKGSHGMIYEVISSLQRLFVHLDKKLQNIPQHASGYYQECLLLGKEKLDHYWKIVLYQGPYYAAAVIVHSTLNFTWFKDKWWSYPDWTAQLKKQFEDFFKTWTSKANQCDVITEEQTIPSDCEWPSKRCQQDSQASIDSEEAEFDDILTVNWEYTADWSASAILSNESNIQAELTSWLKFVPATEQIKVSYLDY